MSYNLSHKQVLIDFLAQKFAECVLFFKKFSFLSSNGWFYFIRTHGIDIYKKGKRRKRFCNRSRVLVNLKSYINGKLNAECARASARFSAPPFSTPPSMDPKRQPKEREWNCSLIFVGVLCLLSKFAECTS